MTDHLTSFFPAGRDRGVTVAVEGFFAFVWFGWGQAAPPSWLVVPLAVGAGLAVLLTVAGVVLTTRSAGPLRVMADPAVRRRYSIIVGLEFGLLGAGAAVLGATGQARWIPVWICAGVGVHFFPLASTLANRSLRLLGVLLIGVATAALATGLASATAPSTVRGRGRGRVVPARVRPGHPASVPHDPTPEGVNVVFYRIFRAPARRGGRAERERQGGEPGVPGVRGPGGGFAGRRAGRH